MSDDEIDEKIQEIQEYAADHPDFDTTFIDSLEQQYLERGTLSEKQVEALDNILEKWVHR
jgi:hypothetical protein